VVVRSVVLHQVKDYGAWRAVYDEVIAGPAKHGGVRADAVLRSLDDGNHVLVTHDFDDEPSARAWFSSPEIGDAMARAGVVGEPQLIWFGSID
jgi:heme-degrading monooxygenase HmoA